MQVLGGQQRERTMDSERRQIQFPKEDKVTQEQPWGYFGSGLLRISHTLERSKDSNQMNRTEDNCFRMVMKEISHGAVSKKDNTKC